MRQLLKRLKLLKRAWQLTERPHVLEAVDQIIREAEQQAKVEGDEGAVFLGESTEAEYQEWLEEQQGWGGFKRKIEEAQKRDVHDRLYQ